MIPQEQISTIVETLNRDPSKILDAFGVEYETLHNRLIFPCPVHNGDNPKGACIFTDGRSAKGNWACWTRGCHDDYGNNILAFLQGLLSCRNDNEIGFPQVIETAKNIAGDLDFSISCEYYRSSREEKILKIFNYDIEDFELPDINREMVIERLNIPSPYYLGELTNKNVIKRRAYYSREVLEKFDVGDCMELGRDMAYRAVVPVYTDDFRYAGCTGRKIYENNEYPKWKNSESDGVFSSIFYGFHVTKPLIQATMTMIIVEGQGDVWRCYEAGAANCGSMMHSTLTEEQLILLEKLGVLNLIILTDFDEAGHVAAERIMKMGGRRFNYHRPELPKSLMKEIQKFYGKKEPKADVSDLLNDEFKEHILDKVPKGFEIAFKQAV